MGNRHQTDSRSGLAYGLAAYGLWGLMPLYFHAVAGVPAVELLAHRVVWSVLLLLVVLTVVRGWSDLRACLRVSRNRWLLLASTLLIASNWTSLHDRVQQTVSRTRLNREALLCFIRATQ